MILLGVNCGLGPADLGRLRWHMIDLKRGTICFPRPKTGVMRLGYLWKQSRRALNRVRTLKHNKNALAEARGDALVFITRKKLAYYRELEVHQLVDVDGEKVKKLVSVKVDNAILRTFRRMVRELDLEGVTFYRLRHTFKTLGKKAKDREALDLMMGHKDTSTGKIYDHEEIGWRRIKRVATIVRLQLWPPSKRKEGTPPPTTEPAMCVVGANDEQAAAA
jgi:integrase